MILILIYLILASVLIIGTGKFLSKILKLNHNNIFYDFINGLFILLIINWIISFFTGFSIYYNFTLLLIILSVIIYTFIKKDSFARIKIEQFSLFYKFVFGLIFLSVLYNSSQIPFLPDNESYYVQTIKWANEYGITKGLINLHPFLGQFSGWHILQASINYKLIFNDLNALLFLFYIYFLIDKFANYHYKQTNKPIELFLILQIIFTPFLLVFINSPSPDLPVIILSTTAFYLFLKNYKNPNNNEVKQLNIIVFLALLIKLTAFPLLVLLTILYFKHNKKLYIEIKQFMFLLVLSFTLLTTKNYIITGYIFYPFSWFGDIFNPDWQYPSILMNYMSELGKRDNFAIHLSASIFKDFYHWIFQGQLITAVNLFWLGLLVIFPFLSKKLQIDGLKIIYQTAIIYFLLILFISPNIRFYLYFLLFLTTVFIVSYYKLKYEKMSLIFVVLSMIIINFYTGKNDNYTFETHFVVNPISKYSGRIKRDKIGNLEYYYPTQKKLFWQTGDAKIPAVQKKQIEYFKKNFHFIPQKRTEFLKDGFFSSKIFSE